MDRREQSTLATREEMDGAAGHAAGIVVGARPPRRTDDRGRLSATLADVSASVVERIMARQALDTMRESRAAVRTVIAPARRGRERLAGSRIARRGAEGRAECLGETNERWS
jgi:hypothetical protein